MSKASKYQDIYKQMAKNNPALALMKEKLQLQLD